MFDNNKKHNTRKMIKVIKNWERAWKIWHQSVVYQVLQVVV